MFKAICIPIDICSYYEDGFTKGVKNRMHNQLVSQLGDSNIELAFTQILVDLSMYILYFSIGSTFRKYLSVQAIGLNIAHLVKRPV